MNYLQISSRLDSYKNGETGRGWKMDSEIIGYENDYLKIVRVDSSNRWISSAEMEKQWGIIVDLKRDITVFPGFRQLCDEYGMKLTPVRSGVNKGCFGFRFYHMKQDPDYEIIQDILNFIFTS